MTAFVNYSDLKEFIEAVKDYADKKLSTSSTKSN